MLAGLLVAAGTDLEVEEMRNRNHSFRLKLCRSRLIAAGLSVAVLLSLGIGACGSSATGSTSASSATNAVVPATGTVAGKGYAYWLERAFLLDFTNLHNPQCMTVSVGGVRVALLDGLGVKPGSWTCNEPVGRAIYMGEPAYECSSLSGDHTGYGTTPADLEKCAKANWDSGTKGVSFSQQLLDGHSVNLHQLVTATGEFYVPGARSLVAPSPPDRHSWDPWYAVSNRDGGVSLRSWRRVVALVSGQALVAAGILSV